MQPQFLNIKLTTESIDILINAMREIPMPHKISNDLIVDLHTQRKNELDAIAAAEKAKAEKKVNKAKPVKKAAAEPAPAAPTGGEDDMLS